MKRFFSLLVAAFLGLSLLVLISGLAFADSGCPLTGNTYIFDAGDIQYELSGFVCTFGPGCRAECDLWYGNFDTGPLYHERLSFACEPGGDIIIAGIPCALNSQGNLECLTVDISRYTCVRLGTKMWCLPEKPGEFQFDLN